jgi:glyoxylase-like metal-dependent hydrolase (beta-lactamase superfamily II)
MTALANLNAGIFCVDAAHMRDELASIYILREGEEVAIIDTGTQHSLSNVLDALNQLDIKHHQIKYVIPTHIHLDHAGGAGVMMECFDQARLVIHPRGARHMADPQRLVAGSIEVYGETLFRQLYGEIRPISEDRIEIADDLATRYLEKRELLFIDSPGHARHHFCIYDAQSRGIFSGDSFGICYPPLKHHARGLIPTSSPVQFDPVALKNTIDRLVSYAPEQMYLTHFGALDNPVARATDLKRWIDDYVSLCESIKPVDDLAEQQLENAMRNMIFAEISDLGLSDTELRRVLDTDIKLNSQGLAIWWRSNLND